jgi:hypothetical protein
MTKNPYLNALFALIYIVVIVLSFSFITDTEINTGIGQYTAPIIMLSLLTLSVAFMGYAFFFQPIKMYLDGKKKEAVSFFLKTIATFAILIVILFFANLFVTKI